MFSLRGSFARLLICNLLVPAPMVASEPDQPTPDHSARSSYVSTELQGDQRILHALNRFSFGPCPGDLEKVRALGLDKWFDQQLKPASIDNADLNARLARYPAMQWTTQDLMFRAPSNAMIRQAANGNGNVMVPQSGVLRAVYKNAIYRMQTRKAEKAESAPNGQQPNAMPPAEPADASMAPSPDNTDSMNFAARMGAIDDNAQTAKVLVLPPDQRVMKLATMQPSEFESFAKSLRPPQRLALVADLAPAQRETVAALENPERLVVGELMAQRLARDIYSNAQLQEVMTDFWFNHFNIFLRKNEVMPYYLVSYERDVIRPRALGKFEDLLESVAHSPAMMVYLDNAESIGPHSLAVERGQRVQFRRLPDAKRKAPEGLNENYARELMELHTLGVNGGYTQADVTEVARVLTGWTIDRPLRGGDFQFNQNRHEPGTKKVMGEKFKEDGEKEGRELLHFLATRPATAQFLSRKLAIRFVSDDPPQALVDRMAKAYLSSGGDIPTVLRTLFQSPEFWAQSDFRAKVKTPLEFVVSAARASNADVQNFEPILNALRQMGMPLYGCVPPSGWDWKESTWVSTSSLVDRMNFAVAMASNRFFGVTVAWSDEATVSTADAEQDETRLEPMIVPGGVSVSTRSAALQQFQAQIADDSQNANSVRPLRANQNLNRPLARAAAATTPERPSPREQASPRERQDQMLAGLLIGSPEFQRR
jgi:uncharacterized protein (DUF1800 family)